MHVARLRVIVALVASMAIGCETAPTAAQAPPASSSSAAAGGSEVVVAEIGGRRITLAEVDAKWQEFDAAERTRVTQLLYQNRRNMLDLLMGDLLIAEAAKSASLSVEAYTEREVTRRLKPVSDTDVRQFYDENKERAGGRTLDELRQPILDFLQSQRQAQARAALVDELRGKAGNVRVLLEPPRIEVPLADDDPVRGAATAVVTLVEYSDYQ